MPTLRDLVSRIRFVVNSKPLIDVQKEIAGVRSRLDMLVASEAFRWLGDIADRFGNLAIDIQKGAAAAGISTEAFQRLSYAAAQNGVGQEVMAKALTSLNRKLLDVRFGSDEAALAFAQAGVPPSTLGSLHNAEDALQAVGGALNRIQDPIKRAALAERLLGEGGTRLLLSLNNGKQGLEALSHSAEATSAVLTDKQLAALAATEAALVGLRQAATATAAKFAAAFAPLAKAVLADFARVRGATAGLGDLSLKRFVGAVAFAFGFVRRIAYEMYKALRVVFEGLYKFGRDNHIFDGVKTGIMLAATIIGQVLRALGVAIGGAAYAIYDQFATMTQSLGKIRDDVADLLGSIQSLFRGFSVAKVGDVLKATFGTLWDVIATPVRQIEAAISDLIGLFDDLYKSLFGHSFADSAIIKALSFIANIKPAMPGDVAPAMGGAKSQAPSIDQMVQNMQPALPVQGGAGGAGSSVSINAPITVNVSGNADTKAVTQSVKDAISGHFDMVRQQAQVAATPGMAY